jgi:hypothetical protein
MSLEKGDTLDPRELPNRQGMMRINRRTELQDALLGFGMVAPLAAFLLFMQAKYGRHHYGYYRPPNPALLPYAWVCLGIGVVFVAIGVCVRNYYLIDPVRRCIYRGRKILWFDRVRLLHLKEDIVGIATDGKRTTTKYGSYWSYRLVALTKEGRQEPLSSWRRKDLDSCNADAARAADMLRCECHPADSESRLRFQMEGERPVVSFDPYSWNFSTATVMRWVIVLLLVAVLAYLRFMVRR